MKLKLKRNNIIHYNMALVGGVFGGFAVSNLGEVFGNAQTLNLIGVVYNLINCKFDVLLLRIIAALLYFFGFALAAVAHRKSKIRADMLSFAIDAASFLALAFMPKDAPVMISLYPIFFATAFQWTVFEYIDGYSSSTIFSSNNYRQFATSLVEYLIDRDKSRLTKTRVFGFTLLYFHLGVLVACLGTLFTGRISALIGILALVPAVALTLNNR